MRQRALKGVLMSIGSRMAEDQPRFCRYFHLQLHQPALMTGCASYVETTCQCLKDVERYLDEVYDLMMHYKINGTFEVHSEGGTQKIGITALK
jgi:hypothetical protein